MEGFLTLKGGGVELVCYKEEDRLFQFKIHLEGGKAVGFCDLRLSRSAEEFYIGNVGYSVFPDERGKGIGAKALALMCDFAFEKGEKYLMACCKRDNIASKRTIEKCGGFFVDSRALPDFMELRYGRHTVDRYKIALPVRDDLKRRLI